MVFGKASGVKEKLSSKMSLRIPAELRAGLEEEARRLERTVNWVARKFIQEGLARARRQGAGGGERGAGKKKKPI